MFSKGLAHSDHPKSEDDANKLTLRQKLLLTDNKTAMFTEEDICFDWLIEHGCKAVHLHASGFRPRRLRAAPLNLELKHLRRLGFTALDLSNETFAREMGAVYGIDAVVQAFLQSPSDAVMLANTSAAVEFAIDTDRLLSSCAGSPTHAQNVIRQVDRGLTGVNVRTLLDCGLNRTLLVKLGVTDADVRLMPGTPFDFTKLGYPFR